VARLGLFGRIGKAIGRVADAIADAVTPKPEPRRATPPTPKPPERRRRGLRGRRARARAEEARREQERRERQERAARDRQRAREADPYRYTWNGLDLRDKEGNERGNYLGHLDFFRNNIVDRHNLDLDPDEARELWEDYLRYMVSGSYKRNELSNPFWQASGIHPDNFDWWGWREAMGYPHGNRSR